MLLIIADGCSREDGSINDPTVATGTVKDIDGNVYKTIQIEIRTGMLKSLNNTETISQTWMAENLRTTKYSNGDPIPNVTQCNDWLALTTGAYCSYNNDLNNSKTYGMLYNWYAVKDSRNLAPEGWHVASYSEWMTLINFLGGLNDAGGKLKEAGTTHWLSPNTDADNSIGFTALPAGFCYNFFSAFDYLNTVCYWWTTTEHLNHNGGPWRVGAYYTSSSVSMANDLETTGFSVRCIKD